VSSNILMQFLLESWYCPLNQITLHHYVIAYLGEWRRGTTPLRSLRTGRDSLPSSSSYCPALAWGGLQWAKSTGCLRIMLCNQCHAGWWCPLNLLYFRVAHRTRILFMCWRTR